MSITKLNNFDRMPIQYHEQKTKSTEDIHMTTETMKSG